MITDNEISQFLKNQLLNQGNIYDKEFILEKRRTVIISCSVMPLVQDGKIRGNLIHIEDITDKRSKEARLRRAENLAALTTLTAGVAHEIKNPLGSISIHLQLIQKKIGGKERISTKKITGFLNVINEEVDRLNRIIIDFLFTVRPMDTKLEKKDINQIISEILGFLKFELKEDNITVESRFSQSLPLLQLDEKYIKQALLNLIKNAQSAMPEGGVIKLTTERKADDVVVRISDTGTGIPDDILHKIFEPYFTTKPFGTGLGLTMVYKIIKEHQGDLAVRSKKNEGTAFDLIFPVPAIEKRLLDYEGDIYESQNTHS